MSVRHQLQHEVRRKMVAAGFAVVAFHLVASALFFMDATVFGRLFWAVVAVVALGAATYAYERQGRAGRGLILLMVGLSGVLVGVGIHVSHVYQVGVSASDVTGIAMLVAAAFLTVRGGIALAGLIHTWWRRLLLVVPLVPVAFFLIFPVGVGVFATNVARYPCCDETPADRGMVYEDVSFQTAENLELSAWFIPTRNGATIITVHGAGKNRATVLDEAEVLVQHGYGALMLDIEGFGDSEGRANAFGWVGARDVHAAVEYLRSRSDVDGERIGAVGLSMGGEVLLQAAGESDGLKAIVAEGATGRTAADFSELGTGPIIPFHWVLGGTMRLISGEPTPPPLKQMVQQIAPRSVLLIAADLEDETKLMGLYLELGGASFDLWTIPESRHVGSFDLHREEWEARVVAFFDGALLGP